MAIQAKKVSEEPKEVYLYKKLSDKKVQCQTCGHYCIISPDKRGICGVRENLNGKLYALNYGKIIACNIDPIEKKPLFHFLPGTFTYSIATVGCNLACQNCQNWDISQASKFERAQIVGEKLSPEEIVSDAIKNDCPSIAYTYTEPTIFLELALDTMKIAKKKGLKNVWVSNGFMSEESARLVIPYLDANNIDIKGFSEDFYRSNCKAKLEPVLNTAKSMKKSGVWVEITTLSIPTLSDSDEMFRGIAKFIYDELGSETPWHVSQFSGAISWKLKNLPETPVETLEKAYRIGKKAGLKYVYTGNVPGLPSEDTFCPKCGALMIDRTGYEIHRYDKNEKCSKCDENLNLTLK
ncbi:MAG: AmmeMemoRadiSam system radical SAM enzyme [Candidatus Nealsonbacteria bacterium CG_4_10_14_0_2_um_filter_38_17]|uniref:AmmeMemoRadiSam system radical SAM enzyme n=2 Tax=Candidatus Nealsoniibacteriota TaxID=1817911 RepID=A0A2M7UYW8_9BACT|nr:MAG: AmmeMemoRadiSam system radical SAM enzyme [Candidatus Nealsonbacteria bacterium CG23_combo_of_CG06-09_8_20_14_all_38_19]PIZ89118.1 MAG: AmmeMemoRadiSam system radical SAM enzyme [Candidatus Nealsonbacteria bacterium CG_4_10_14_0_2_um_filter_38_17]